MRQSTVQVRRLSSISRTALRLTESFALPAVTTTYECSRETRARAHRNYRSQLVELQHLKPGKSSGHVPALCDGIQANGELGRRVRSWKASYLKEVSKRKELETELLHIRQVTRKNMLPIASSRQRCERTCIISANKGKPRFVECVRLHPPHSTEG